MKWRTLQRNLWIEAAIALVAGQMAVRLLPAGKVLAWAERGPRHPRRFTDPELPAWIAAAVDSIGSRPWMNAACLARALAAQTMLRRRGIAARLCLGVARDDGALSAHAWVELGEDVIIGATERCFARVGEFGRPAA